MLLSASQVLMQDVQVEASGWLTHVQSILMTSVKTVTHLEHVCPQRLRLLFSYIC